MPATLQWIRALLIALTTAGLAAQKTPEEALRALAEGNRRFAADRSVPQPVGEGVRRTLARGQNPFAVVLCCSDSRVPPEHVFNCGLGELFVVRVAGNTCDRETLASIEYAVEHLNVPLCVVLGHEDCGAVAAAVEQVQALDHDQAQPAASRAIQQLLEQIEPAVRKARARDLGGKELCDACEEENTHRTLHECLRRSPLLRRYVQVGRLQMAAARYHLGNGEVEWLPNRPLPPEPRHDVDHSLHAAPIVVPPHVALRMLQAGHRRFVGDSLPAGDLTADRREQLTHGQQPLAIVLTCSDSRTAPEHVFDAGLGELFVIRVAGNVVNDDVLASIEYAAAHTGASLLIVMGHTSCGAITAAASHPEGQQLSPNMRALLSRFEPSIEKVRGRARDKDHLVELAVAANVLRTSLEVQSRSQILRDLEAKGRFSILPTVYDIASGDLTWLKDVPRQDVAMPPAAAPMGEVAARGHDDDDHAAPAADPQPHGQARQAHGEQGTDAHGAGTATGHAEPPVPGQVLNWTDPIASRNNEAQPQGHDTGNGHDETAGHDTGGGGGSDHGHGHDTDAAEHDAGSGRTMHDGHGKAVDTHGHDHAHRPGDRNATNLWSEPIPIVGIAGIISLLLAAMIAMFKK